MPRMCHSAIFRIVLASAIESLLSPLSWTFKHPERTLSAGGYRLWFIRVCQRRLGKTRRVTTLLSISGG